MFGTEKRVTIPQAVTLRPLQRQRRPSPAAASEPAPTAAARARSAWPRGSSASASPARTARGQGEIIEKPCRKCHGEGRVTERKTIPIRIPRRSGHRHPAPRVRRRPGGPAGRTARRPPGGDPCASPRRVHARGGRHLLRRPAALPGGGSGRQGEGAPPSAAPPRSGSRQEPRTARTSASATRGYLPSEATGAETRHVRITIEVPTKLSAAQKEKLQEFADVCDDSTNPKWREFLEKAKRFLLVTPPSPPIPAHPGRPARPGVGPGPGGAPPGGHESEEHNRREVPCRTRQRRRAGQKAGRSGAGQVRQPKGSGRAARGVAGRRCPDPAIGPGLVFGTSGSACGRHPADSRPDGPIRTCTSAGSPPPCCRICSFGSISGDRWSDRFRVAARVAAADPVTAAMEQALDDEDATVVRNVLQVAAQFAMPLAQDKVLARLGHADRDVRVLALQALRRLPNRNDRELAARLAPLVKDKDATIRRETASALARCGAAALPGLRALAGGQGAGSPSGGGQAVGAAAGRGMLPPSSWPCSAIRRSIPTSGPPSSTTSCSSRDRLSISWASSRARGPLRCAPPRSRPWATASSPTAPPRRTSSLPC